MANKKKKKSFEKEEYISKKYVFDINIRSFLTIFFFGLIAYFILCFFVYDNISNDALDIFILIGISIITLFAAYVTFKVLKLIYCIGYNVFLLIDTRFSIFEKYQKIISSPKTKKIQTQDYIDSLQKEIEELNHKLAESQNIINELSQKLKNENEVSESESNQKSTLVENIKSFWGVGDNNSISLKSDSNTDMTDENFMEIANTDIKFESGSDVDFVIRGAKVAVEAGQLSTAMLQKKLKLGYARASRIMDKLEEMGVIGASEGAKPRKVLIDMKQYEKLVQEHLEHEKSLSDLIHSENDKSKKKVIEYSDPLIPETVEFAVRNNQLSILMLQKRLKLGHIKASHIMKELKKLGIISADDESNVLITKEDYDNISFQNKSENLLNNMTYNEFVELPEYKVLKEYVSKLKIIDLKKFINELSPFDYNKTINVLSVLMADGTLIEYTDGHYLYAEYDAILSAVDNMSDNGIEFEHFTAELLSKNGFTNIKLTQSSGDYGIDVLAEKDSVTYAIQCKCYSNAVGNKAIQEAYSGKDFYRCMVAVVFTNNYFTKSAIQTAKQNNVILWDRNKLIELIKPLQTENHISRLLAKMSDYIIAIYKTHGIPLEICEIYPDSNGTLLEFKISNADDMTNIRLYINELQEKLNTEVILREPLNYPKVYIYVNYSEDLQNAYNNHHLKSI